MAGRGIRDFLAEDEAQRTLKGLVHAVTELKNRIELMEILQAPKTEDRMFTKPFQRKLVGPGKEEEVYRQDVPNGYVGVITRVGNDWFDSTSLKRFIDSRAMEATIERVIASVTDPMAVKIFVKNQVVWTAKNNDLIDHTFGVLTDGFFVPFDVFDRVIAVEG